MEKKILVIILMLLMVPLFTLSVFAGTKSGYSNLPVARSAGRSIARFAVEHSRHYTPNDSNVRPSSTTVYYLPSGRTVIDTPNGTTQIGRGIFPRLRQRIIQGIAEAVLPNARTYSGIHTPSRSMRGMTTSGSGSTGTSAAATAYLQTESQRNRK